jgi:lipoyl(octanoyl) transferase
MNFEVKISQKPIDYKKSIEILEKRVADVSDGKKSEFLWIIEHKKVYTAGIRSDKSELLNKRIKVIKTNRGGKYTYHGPGQKVIYFVLNLNKREKDIRKLIYRIELCIINILKEYGIKSYADKENIGIWIGDKKNSKKIAAIGIRVKKWIAYHGFSINIETDLKKYNAIIPCGIKNKGITSFKEMGISKANNIDNIIVKNFLNTFQ